MASQNEELKIVISAEERASREIDRLTKKLTSFQSRISDAFKVPVISNSLNSKAVTEAFKKYGQGISQINERHTRWANNEARMGRLTHDNWQRMNADLQKYLKKDGEVRALRGKQIEQFIELTRRMRAYEQVWSRGHDRYLSAKRREQEIFDQVERAKERLGNLGFINEKRRRAAIDALDRQRSRAFLAEERRKEQLKINSWKLQMRQDAASRRAEERAAEDAYRQRVGRNQARAQAAMGLPGNLLSGTASVAIVATGIEYAVARAVESVFATRRSVDRAETNLMMFGGLDRAQVNQARSGWLDKAAMQNGFGPAAAINAYTEVLKAGIPDAAAAAVTKSIMGASAGMDLNVADTTKLVGRLSTLTQNPANFNAGAIDGMLNAMAVVAKVTAADTNEIVSALRRGAGALGSSKLSVGDLAAFTGVGISAGMQEGKAGTFMDFTVNELVNAKNSRGQRRADLQKGLQLAGLGSLSKVSRDAANNPAELMMALFEKMASVSPEKAGQIASLIFMREWRGEALQMAKSSPMLRRTINAERADTDNTHLRQAKDLSLMSLDGLMRQIGAVVGQIKDAAGKGLEPTFRAIARFLIDFGQNVDFKVITDHIEVLIEGITSGFGMGSIPEILASIFGKPGELNGDTLGKWLLFGRGIGRGLREFLDAIRSISTDMGIGSETLGLWTTRIATWSQAIQALRPAIDLMDTFFKVIGGILVMFTGSALLRTLATIAAGGGGAAAAGAAGAAGGAGLGAILAGALIPVSIVGISAAVVAALMGRDATKGLWLGVPSGKQEDPNPENRAKGQLGRELGRAAVDPRFQRQSYQGEVLKNLIHKAGLTSFDDRSDAMDRLGNTVRAMGAQFQLASLGGGPLAGLGTGGVGGSFGGGGGGGIDAARSFGKNFFTPNGMSVPGWHGKGSGSGGSGGSGAPIGIPSNIPMSASERNTLGLILKYEGGYKNQMNYMGKRQGIDPATPKGYTAQGYYQMLNSNWRRIAPLYGIKTPNAMASSLEDQTKVALHLLRNGGVGNWANYNPRLRAALARGEQAPAGVVPGLGNAASGLGPNVPALSGAFKSGAEGLRIKSGEATAGGRTDPAIFAAAQMIQSGNVAGGLKRFTAFNDLYHKGTGSKHASGLAGDFTLNDPSKSRAAAEQVRQMFRSAGLSDRDFKVIDEYTNPSRRATGGHIHYQINSAQAALQYAQAVQARAVAAAKSMKDVAEAGRKADAVEFKSTGWQPGAGGNTTALSGVPAKPSTDDMIRNVPMPPRRPAGMGGPGGGGGSVHITQHIHGSGNTPEEVANLAQRKITEDWNHRSHDLEPELT